jgi:uncharacterized GH25 family protein
LKRILLAVAALAFARALHAHDFWIEPSTYHPAFGQTVSLALRVGMDFTGDPVPRVSDNIASFTIRQGRKGPQDVAGIERADPAGFFTADARSTAVVAYASLPSPVELEPAKFEAYLRQYGLDAIIDARTRRRERQKPGKEIFSRCAKSLIAGAHASLAATHAVGLRYEIVPMIDPTRGDAHFRGRMLFERTPAANALVTAVFHDDPSVRVSARSDHAGVFALTLPRPGVWLIKSVRMVEAPHGSDADWESFWASLTFELPPSPR